MDTVFDNEDQEMEIMEKLHCWKDFDEVFKDMKPFQIALAVWNAWAFNPENPDDHSRKYFLWHEYFVWEDYSLYSVYEDDIEAWEEWQKRLKKNENKS